MASCVFCELPFQGPDRQRSREHAYPSWIAKYVPGADIERREVRTAHFGTAEVNAGYKRQTRAMPINAFDQKVKHVCVPCNTGWMEQIIEREARRSLIPFFEGEELRLAYGDIRALAAWVWKTAAMITLLTDKASRPVAPSEFHWFFNRRTPPFRSMLWMGRYEGSDFRESWVPWSMTTQLEEEPLPDGAPHNAYSMFFTVGPVVFFVFGTSAPHPAPLGPQGALIPVVSRIWPIAPGEVLHWPPRGGLVGDFLLEQVGRSFVDLGIGGGLARGESGTAWGALSS